MAIQWMIVTKMMMVGSTNGTTQLGAQYQTVPGGQCLLRQIAELQMPVLHSALPLPGFTRLRI